MSDLSSGSETSGVTTGLVVRYVREHGGESAVTELLRRAAVPHPLAELQDESRWVSYDTRIRLFEAAAQVLGDPDCTFAMGAAALRTGLNHSLVLVLRALGSPAQVYRQLPRAVPKFSATSTMEVLELAPGRATVRFRLHEGYRHSRLDCRYAQGLIQIVPEIFGLPPATLVHDRCQSDGAEACVYRVRWTARTRLPWLRSRRSTELELAALRGQLHALQSAATELVESDDLSLTLRRITHRAAAAVLAPSYLLAVADPQGGGPLVHSEGLPQHEVAPLADRLLAGEDLGEGAVVVDVASSRRWHGRLAAMYLPGQRGLDDERSLLSAYAGHAAAALDLLLALEDSRRGQSRSDALLTLAHELQAATDETTIADVVVSALPGIVGCSASAVLLWDAAAGALLPVASAGLTPDQWAVMHAGPIRADDTPELVEMLARQEPRIIPADEATPALRDLLLALDLAGCVVVPLVAGGDLLGVATASWRDGPMPVDLREGIARLQGVGEYAATALQNARLLAKVQHQAHHDTLTGLPNRLLFTRTLDQTLLALEPGRSAAVLFCDLDKFKRVNDDFGHAAGDELLRQVSARIAGAIRGHDVAARLSGDEFAVLLPDVGDPLAADSLGRRVVACFQSPFRIDGRELRVTTSVGVALQTGPGGRADRLLRQADTAMYTAKVRGRNQVAVAPAGAVVPAPGATAPAPAPVAQASLEAELVRALREDELRLAFQPIWSVRPELGRQEIAASARAVGVEALVRWQHPRLGLLGPAAFLPLAEEAGLVVELDLWAIRTACARAAAHGAGGRGLHVAVNLASSTLADPRLQPAVRSALAEHGLRPEQLYLEVVESRALLDVPALAGRLTALRRLGVRIALDDFGTGYSTLTWVQRLPVDQVKVDRSFTAGLPHDAAALAVTRSVLALARDLGVEIVAEGVETADQLAALVGAGCTLVQGYLLGRPAFELPELGGRPSPAADPQATARG
ncbi:putative bifunctional diguanylate cyclase/phosphodiesterase [Cellulomonas aerilata]|uniref:Bifunctional diguanylate cyclase/phosphodiesterase n=1 Tax=Cellulomonas aerilata TaxID=515326 RepID=A0A512DCB7_9CELL|nr:EAL domain-containing protein [Cellulomonas aerilata]GEO34067.1 hypothetical protein CAE01nite_17920 [Cellulomonas aerilata]